MIITRSPLRIPLGGGGTDLPSYFQLREGMFFSVAIDKYVYVTVSRTFVPECILKYSEVEVVMTDVDEIQHPIIREAIRITNTDIRSLEITSMADVHAGTGMGSSGAFTVALLKALHLLQGDCVGPHDLAEEACRIEIEVLREPIGKQDQYVSAYGGLGSYRILKDGTVIHGNPVISPHIVQTLEDDMLLFFTGATRKAGQILADQDKRTRSADKDMLENLDHVKLLGVQGLSALEAGDISKFAATMRDHWAWKQKRAGTVDERIAQLHSLGMSNGALCGKLIGAGGGGFLLFLVPKAEHSRIRSAMAEECIVELPFRFSWSGVTQIV